MSGDSNCRVGVRTQNLWRSLRVIESTHLLQCGLATPAKHIALRLQLYAKILPLQFLRVASPNTALLHAKLVKVKCRASFPELKRIIF